GTEMTIHYAVESGLKLTEKTVRNGNASTEQYSDYKEVDGIKIPFNISSNLGPQSIDRKSTRLNSSHVSISYAVFCLKKKNVLGIKRYGISILLDGISRWSWILLGVILLG